MASEKSTYDATLGKETSNTIMNPVEADAPNSFIRMSHAALSRAHPPPLPANPKSSEGWTDRGLRGRQGEGKGSEVSGALSLERLNVYDILKATSFVLILRSSFAFRH